jgi:hypothetical protein
MDPVLTTGILALALWLFVGFFRIQGEARAPTWVIPAPKAQVRLFTGLFTVLAVIATLVFVLGLIEAVWKRLNPSG